MATETTENDGYLGGYDNYLETANLRNLPQGGKLKIAHCNLEAPGAAVDADVSWYLTVTRGFTTERATVRVEGVEGHGKGNVRFSGRIVKEVWWGNAANGPAVDIGPDGIIGDIVVDYGRSEKLWINVCVYCCDARPDNRLGSRLGRDLGRLLDQDRDMHGDVVLQVGELQVPLGPPLGQDMDVEDKQDDDHKHALEQLEQQPAGKERRGPGRTKEVKAHKAVLSARSPFFQQLFQTDMAETRNNRVVVDFPVDVFDKVLQFIYTGSAGDLDGCEDAVMAAADYYQLEGLKRVCEDRLLRRVVPDDVLGTLVLADRYHAHNLKSKALDVAVDNLKRVRLSAEWKHFSRSHYALVDEIMEVVAERLEQAQEQASECKKRKHTLGGGCTGPGAGGASTGSFYRIQFCPSSPAIPSRSTPTLRAVAVPVSRAQ